MYNLTVAAAHTYFVGEGQWLVHNSCFKIEGQLKEIWDNPRYFKNWHKNTQSLRRVDSPLSHTEAMQILENAQKHGIPVDLNSAGLQGLEITGQWAGIPHFKVANVHIPVQLGFKP